MVGDKAKYERLAKHRFTTAATKKTSNKDQVTRDQNLIAQMVSLASDNNGSSVQGPTSVTVLVVSLASEALITMGVQYRDLLLSQY